MNLTVRAGAAVLLLAAVTARADQNLLEQIASAPDPDQLRATVQALLGWRVEADLNNDIVGDFAFGVSAVSEDGYESPVEFPGLTGGFWPPSR